MHCDFITILGTRPEIVQFAPLLRKLDTSFNHKYIYTNQHVSENMKQFGALGMRSPDFTLKQESSYPEAIMLSLLELIGNYDLTFDNLIIFGYSNSSLGSVYAVDKLKTRNRKVNIIHINGGLRCHNPLLSEEKTCKYIDRISDYILCPTRHDQLNVVSEGIRGKSYHVGDLLFDTFAEAQVGAHEVKIDKPYVIIDVHRPFNIDNKYILNNLFTEFNKIPYPVVFLAHPNTEDQLAKYRIQIAPHIKVIEPLPYPEFIDLLKNSFAIVTDSINVPLEASILGIPCLSIRNETERPNTVVYGTNILVGSNISLLNFYLDMLEDTDYKHRFGIMKQDYSASDNIINILRGIKYTEILELEVIKVHNQLRY